MNSRKVLIPSPLGILVGLLTYPSKKSKDQKFPLVILLGGWKTGQMRSTRNKKLSQLLTQQGIATLALNLPGHGAEGEESEGTLETFTITKGVQAVEAAIRWLQIRRNVDTMRLGILGTSVGGSVAFKAMAELNGMFSAGVFLNARTSFDDARPGLYSWTEGDKRRVNRVLMRDGRRMDRTKLAKNIQAPTLWMFGEKDTIVPRSHTTQVVSAAKKAEIFMIVGGDHSLRNHTDEVAVHAVNFFGRELLY